MKLTKRDLRAVAALAAAALIAAIMLLLPGGGQTTVVGATDSIPLAERRLARARQLASTVPGKEEVLKQLSAELAEREKGVIQAATAAQAQAQLLEIVRRVARSQTSPIELGSVELAQQVAKLGEDYGEVAITVPFTAKVEDLVNFMADLTRQPEAVATTTVSVVAGDARQKTVAVRLTIAGVVPRRLVPEKKGIF